MGEEGSVPVSEDDKVTSNCVVGQLAERIRDA